MLAANARQEALGALVLRVVDDVARRAGLDDDASRAQPLQFLLRFQRPRWRLVWCSKLRIGKSTRWLNVQCVVLKITNRTTVVLKILRVGNVAKRVIYGECVPIKRLVL